MSNNEQHLRERAYHIWEAEGKPHGEHHRHWQMACQVQSTDIQAATEPLEPLNPSEPARPTETPSQPIKPQEPLEPINPSQPFEPGEPAQPIDPVAKKSTRKAKPQDALAAEPVKKAAAPKKAAAATNKKDGDKLATATQQAKTQRAKK